MKQDWVDGSVAPMGARSWSSPSDYHSVLVSHGIQLLQRGGLLLGEGTLVSLAVAGGIGPGALACTCCQIKLAGAQRAGGQGGDHPTTTPKLATQHQV